MKKYLFVFLFVVIAATSCGNIETEEIKTEETEKNFSHEEEAYYGKYVELAEKYGTCSLYDYNNTERIFEGHSYLNGVCVVNLMDFDGDGTKDLFVAYSNGEMEKTDNGGLYLESYDFPAEDTYEFEIWTYKDGELAQILHESKVSAGNRYYSYRYKFITVFENKEGLPVIQLYNENEGYTNIYCSDGKIVRDKLIYSENVYGYNRILLCSYLADSGCSSELLSEVYGIDYNNTLQQTKRVVKYLSQEDDASTWESFDIVEEEYISLYMEEIMKSNAFSCIEDSDYIFTDHHYALYDIDRDGVPELILYEGSSGAGEHYHFYTIDDGEVIQCGFYGRANLLVNGEGGLIAFFAHMGAYQFDQLTLENAEIKTTLISEDYAGQSEYPELEDFGYENYKSLGFCPPTIPWAFYTYGQDLLN